MRLSLEEYRTIFMMVSLVLIIGAAFPGLSVVLPFPTGGERFSEFWLLGPEHMAENYPLNVIVGEQYTVFVGVGCHTGEPTYYAIHVKLRNQTQPSPNTSASLPSSLSPLYEFEAFVGDGASWEIQVDFTILDISVGINSTFVRQLSMNDVVFEENSTAIWDSEYEGYFYQLFFELWKYDDAMDKFQYHNRYVGIWLNMTV